MTTATEMTITEARQICEAFAIKHKVIFQDEGECGFGRPCVGFSSGNNWIDHNPTHDETREPIEGTVCKGAWPPEGVAAYHKHNCLAVLGRGDSAIIQLAQWVQSMQSQGEVEIIAFETGARGLQAILTGIWGRCVIIKPHSTAALRDRTAERE